MPHVAGCPRTRGSRDRCGAESNPRLQPFPACAALHSKVLCAWQKKCLAARRSGRRKALFETAPILMPAKKTALYTDAVRGEFSASDPAALHRASFENVLDADFVNQMLYVDTKLFMPSLNLNYNDKMSMASSVEVRVPFLDRELAEFAAWNVPPDLKLKGFLRPTTKHIFRQAMRGVLPREVLKQPKAGFAAPVDYWLTNDLRGMVDDLLCESNIRRRGLFRPEEVRRFVNEHRSGAQDWSMQIWQFLTLEHWMRVFVDSSTHQSTETFDPLAEAATA